MDGQDFKIFRWLRPVAWLYGVGVELRNKLFDWGWLRSESFSLPVICVGNLAVGGTGKTPHTEYLIRLLRSQRLNVATLSRGYRRKTTGYVLADVQSSVTSIGDEPRQMKAKFPDVSPARARRAKYASSPKSERERLVQKYMKKEQDIVTYENNIGFFAMSKNSEPLIRQMQERIDAAKKELMEIGEQIKALDASASKEEE